MLCLKACYYAAGTASLDKLLKSSAARSELLGEEDPFYPLQSLWLASCSTWL
jgi:hypothetical protein